MRGGCGEITTAIRFQLLMTYETIDRSQVM